MPPAAAIKYRPDIDGLRALAILPVILFHAQLACPGGFVGVDIFFVISGFLISSLILQELAAGTFSLASFWERRIRRILPALPTGRNGMNGRAPAAPCDSGTRSIGPRSPA